MSVVTMPSFDNLSNIVQFENIDLPKNPLDVDQLWNDQDVLCDLVRDQYLRRLRETLVHNLRNSKCHQHINQQRQLEQCVDLCMVHMEKRALRQCMVASVYCQAMINMINEVKLSTNNSIMHSSLRYFIESNNKLSLRDKNVQPENDENRSELSVNSTKSDSDELTHFIVNNFSTVNGIPSEETLLKYLQNCPNQEYQLPISDEQPDKLFSDHSFVDNDVSTISWVSDVLDELNLPVASSNILTAALPESDIFDDLNSVLDSSFGFPGSASDVGSVETDVSRGSAECSTIYDSPDFDMFLKYVQGYPEQGNEFFELEESLKHPGPEIKSHRPIESIPELTTLIYDANHNVIRMNKIDEILKSDLKSARIAMEYELQKRTSQLPQALQTRLDERYSDLFGDDHSYEPDPLTEEEQQIVCHRRVVKMVLSFMNPYYVARRISKRVFKDLARIISKKLVNQSFDPDKETVEGMVKACFMENKPIKTVEELHLITSRI